MTTTTRKQKQELDLYAEGSALVERLADKVRGLNARHRVTDQAARKANDLNAATYADVTDAVKALRNLVAALSDSAGHDRKIDLREAINAAREFVGA